MRKTVLVMAVIAGIFAFSMLNRSNKGRFTPAEYDAVLAANRGKVLIINVFASWCPPCKDETPDFVKAYNTLDKSKFEIVGISVDGSGKALEKFIKQYEVSYPVYHADYDLQKKLNTPQIPVSMIYAPNGTLFSSVKGAIDYNTITQTVNTLSR